MFVRRCDVSGDGQMDLDELSAFLTASVSCWTKRKRNVRFVSFQLTIAGKLDQDDENYPKELAIGVFDTLGICAGKKLTKEQFVQGYSHVPHPHSPLLRFSSSSGVKTMRDFASYSAVAINIIPSRRTEHISPLNS